MIRYRVSKSKMLRKKCSLDKDDRGNFISSGANNTFKYSFHALIHVSHVCSFIFDRYIMYKWEQMFTHKAGSTYDL